MKSRFYRHLFGNENKVLRKMVHSFLNLRNFLRLKIFMVSRFDVLSEYFANKNFTDRNGTGMVA